MTPSDFSVLLLAWDEADPSVAVLSGTALPPTLPLVYHLAAQQPVLALYPHLPEAEAGAELAVPDLPPVVPVAPPEPSAAEDQDEISEPVAATAEEVLDAVPAGVRRLPAPDSATAAAPVASLIIGLQDVAEPSAPQVQAALGAPKASAATAATALARSQWPTGGNAPRGLGWETPAVPYLGASVPPPTRPVIGLVPSSPPSPTVREAADLAQAVLSWPAGFSPLAGGAAGLPFESEGQTEQAEQPEEAPEADHATDPALRPMAFDEPTEEIGAAEANDLLAPEDDLTLEAPAEPAPLPEAEAAPAPVPPAPEPSNEPVPRTPPLDGLNARMIQYARQAAQLVRDRSDFGVIYAPTWPAWLAALEIRNSTGVPLVLYAANLASNFAAPAERGWLLEVERMALRRAHLVLVPTESLRAQLQQRYGASIGEVQVVPADDESTLQALLAEKANR